jgi:hypothetical protein
MRRFIRFAVLYAFVATTALYAVTSQRFVSKDKGFQVTLPKGWEQKKNVMGAEIIALRPKGGKNDSFRENVNVVVENMNQKMAAKEYYKASQTVLAKVFNEFKIEKTGHTKIDNHDTYWCIFTHKMGGIRAKVLQYMTTENTRGFVVTGSALPDTFEKYKKDFENTAESLKIEPLKEIVKK